jgi:hypothetical protein
LKILAVLGPIGLTLGFVDIIKRSDGHDDRRSSDRSSRGA